MSTDTTPICLETPPATPPRLDPHALPPATTGRFLLLIATAFASAAELYAWLVERIQVVSDAPASCVQTARTTGTALSPDGLVDWYSSCVTWTQVQEAGVIGVMMLVFVAVTLVIYWALPRWQSRGLIPLDDFVRDDEAWESIDPTGAYGDAIRSVARSIDGIVADRGLQHNVRICVDAASGRGANRAFGRRGRYTLAVDVTLLGQAVRDPEHSRMMAVVRHELAHISNRDIDLTYLTVAVWWGFLCATVLPFTIVAVHAPSTLGDFSWRLIVLLVLLWLVRASVVRSREYYADVRSIETADDESTLARALVPATGTRRSTFEKIKRPGYLVYHPTADQRTNVIRSGERLFRLSPGVAAATGALVGMAYPPAYFLVNLVVSNHLNGPGWICGILFGLLIATVLAGAAWRSALWSASGGGRPVRVLASAVAFTAALLIGLSATPQLSDGGSWRAIVSEAPGAATLIALLLCLGMYAYLRWMLLCAANWLPIAGNPRRAYRIGVAQSALVIGLWLASWFTIVGFVGAGTVVNGSGPSLAALGAIIGAVAFNPVNVLSIWWACAAPILTWQSKRMAENGQRHRWWRSYTDATAAPAIRMTSTPLGLVYVSAAVIVAGYAFAVRPFYPGLTSVLAANDQLVQVPAIDLVPVILILVLPALAITTIGLFLLGLTAGGRGRADRAVASAGTALLPTSVGILVMMLVHVHSAAPQTRSVLTLLSGLSGIGSPAPADRPANASLGLMILALMALMFLLGLPAAALGSLVRSAWSARPSREPTRRPVWLAAALIVPLVLAGGAVGFLSWHEWRISVKAPIADTVDLRSVETVFALDWPHNVDLRDACSRTFRSLSEQTVETTSATHLDVVVAYAAAEARSSSDLTLRTMGEGAVEALRNEKLRQALTDVSVALQYCVAAETST